MSAVTDHEPGRAELEEERDFLLRSLEDLEREHAAGDVDETDYVALKDGYTARAAVVLRSLEQGSAPAPAGPRIRWGRALAYGTLTVVIAVLAGVLLARAVGQRTPTGTVSGSTGDSINTNLSEGRALLGTNPVEALKRYVDVLKVAPDNKEALAYRGWLLVQLGSSNNQPSFVTTGRESLQRALAVAPTYADARFFSGWVKFRLDNDAKGALADWDVFMSNNPPADLRAAVGSLQDEAKASLAGGGASSTSTTVPAPATTVG